jgi:hypothetical protein
VGCGAGVGGKVEVQVGRVKGGGGEQAGIQGESARVLG